MRQRLSLALLVGFVLRPTAALPQTTTTIKEPPPLWDIQLGASFVGTSGNTDTASTGADLSAHRRGEVWKFDGSASAVRNKDHDAVTAEHYFEMIRAQRMLTPLIGLSAGERLERDRFSGIDFRSILDGGLSWALVRKPIWTLDGVTAVAWNRETRTVGVGIDDPVGVLQLLSRIPFGGGDTTERVTYYPDFNMSSAYRTEIEATAQAAMNARLALKIGYLYRYSNAPVPGFRKSDGTTTASLVLRWKATTPAPSP